MDTLWQTFGHEKAKNILSRQLSQSRFSHAYLFSGIAGIGKKTLALEFAKKVLNTDRLSNHPDFQLLDVGNEEIAMEQILGFIGRLGFRPFMGSKKVAIIDNAQNLNLTSANALLKTLEEPSQSTIIILISSSGRLLPTIVSRCLGLHFNEFGPEALEKYGQSKDYQPTEELLSLAFGSISNLEKLLSDQDFLDKQRQLAKDFKALKALSLAERILKVGSYGELDSQELIQQLFFWMQLEALELKSHPESFAKVRSLSESLMSINKNYNKKLVLQGLFMSL